MCGICGELRFGENAPLREEEVIRMRDELVHRGPDDSGVYVSDDGRAGLGFRRLRIIDLSASANQPMPNEDGSVRLVFNGEIYNFASLRRDLESRGHRFRSRSDSEVIVHLYEEKGADCVASLEGMFALAIWDERNRRLLLARDRAGKKPLFYYLDHRRVAFASEIKALFPRADIRLEIDPEAIPYYFMHGYVPCPRTFYRGVRQVEPAAVVTVEHDGTVRSRPYWVLRYAPDPAVARTTANSVTRSEACERTRELVTQAVERRLISDVPLGAFLSGGIDSTIVVGLMSRLMREPVKTFSIGFDGHPAYDETNYARVAAKLFGTDHTEFKVSPSAIGLVEKLIWHHDGPFGDSSAVPTYIVSELTRRHVTVVLTGDGGDELFAGYIRFFAAVLAERVPKTLGHSLNVVASLLASPANDRHPLARAKRFLRSVDLPLYERITRWSSIFFDELDDLLAPELRASIPPVDCLHYIERELEPMKDLTTLSKVLHANFRSYLLDDLLVKMDRCSMANSLEARSPFLDRELVEYVAKLPDRFKLGPAGKTKVVLKEAFADLLPPEILARGKMGFAVPLGAWFRNDLREYIGDLLLARDARYTQYLSASCVHRIVERHQAGHADAAHKLWSLLCFELWLRLLPDWTQRQRLPTAVEPSPRLCSTVQRV